MSFNITNVQDVLTKSPLVQQAQAAAERGPEPQAQVNANEFMDQERMAREEVSQTHSTENRQISDEEKPPEDSHGKKHQEKEDHDGEEPDEQEFKPRVSPDGEGSLLDIDA